MLQLTDYQTTDDAEYDSWLLLEAVGTEPEVADAEPEAAEPEAMDDWTSLLEGRR